MQIPKRKRIELSKAKMKLLNQKVVERDNYTCQNPFCKHVDPLDIPHHIKFKGQGGDDIEENLTTICTRCHRSIHHEGKLKVSGVYPDLKWERAWL